MATIRQLRQRRKVAQNIQQITKAMKMVAAARLKRAQDRVTAARPYAATMREMMTSLSRAVGAEVQHPLLATRLPQNIGFLIVTSDRGLAGSYNSAILREAMARLRQNQAESITTHVELSGKRAILYFRYRGIPPERTYTHFEDKVRFEEVEEFDQESKDLVRKFWDRMMAKYKTEDEYNRQIIDATRSDQPAFIMGFLRLRCHSQHRQHNSRQQRFFHKTSFIIYTFRAATLA